MAESNCANKSIESAFFFLGLSSYNLAMFEYLSV